MTSPEHVTIAPISRALKANVHIPPDFSAAVTPVAEIIYATSTVPVGGTSESVKAEPARTSSSETDKRVSLQLPRMPIIEYTGAWVENRFINSASVQSYLHQTLKDSSLPTPETIFMNNEKVYSVGTQYTHSEYPTPMTLYAIVPGYTYEFKPKSRSGVISIRPELYGIISPLSLQHLPNGLNTIEGGFLSVPLSQLTQHSEKTS